jgi:hypothetical protein
MRLEGHSRSAGTLAWYSAGIMNFLNRESKKFVVGEMRCGRRVAFFHRSIEANTGYELQVNTGGALEPAAGMV